MVSSDAPRKTEGYLDDEIKLDGLEALLPEALEKHWMPNSNRMRTFFGGACLEVVTYVEAEFGSWPYEYGYLEDILVRWKVLW